jgi:hypothetical protein
MARTSQAGPLTFWLSIRVRQYQMQMRRPPTISGGSGSVAAQPSPIRLAVQDAAPASSTSSRRCSRRLDKLV